MYAEAETQERVDLRAIWRELVNDPDAPDRVELTELGEVVSSPSPENRHQLLILLVIRQLEAQLGGYAVPEPSVLTVGAGVRRPDVAWLPADRISETMNIGPMESPPPLVVEVLSPGNRPAQMAHKIRGYLDAGVQEVIVVGIDGKMSFHRKDGVHSQSGMGVKLEWARELFV